MSKLAWFLLILMGVAIHANYIYHIFVSRESAALEPEVENDQAFSL